MSANDPTQTSRLMRICAARSRVQMLANRRTGWAQRVLTQINEGLRVLCGYYQPVIDLVTALEGFVYVAKIAGIHS